MNKPSIISIILTIFISSQLFQSCQKDEEKTVGTGVFFIFGIDDNFDSDYYYAFAEMKNRNVQGTSFINTKYIGGRTGSLTWEMIHEMADNAWDFQCHSHSHPNLTDLSDQEIQEELELVNSTFDYQGLPEPFHMTYPYGRYDERVKDICSEYRHTARAWGANPLNNYTDEGFDFMSYAWCIVDMQSEADLIEIKNYVDEALSTNNVFVSFLLHRIVESDPKEYDTKLIYFQQLLDYIIEKEGNIITMSKAYNEIKMITN